MVFDDSHVWFAIWDGHHNFQSTNSSHPHRHQVIDHHRRVLYVTQRINERTRTQ